jgi:hypothetical protein
LRPAWEAIPQPEMMHILCPALPMTPPQNERPISALSPTFERDDTNPPPPLRYIPEPGLDGLEARDGAEARAAERPNRDCEAIPTDELHKHELKVLSRQTELRTVESRNNDEIKLMSDQSLLSETSLSLVDVYEGTLRSSELSIFRFFSRTWRQTILVSVLGASVWDKVALVCTSLVPS